MIGSRWRIAIAAIAGISVGACSASTGGGGETAPAVGEALTYGPFAASYVGATHGQTEQEIMGQVNTTDFSMGYYLTTHVVRSAGALRIRITVDSIPSLEGSAFMNASDAEKAAGSSFTGILTSDGEILNFTGGDTSVGLVEQLKTSLEEFLPRIPSEGVRPGDVWADTSEVTTPASGLDELTVRSINQHEAVEWTEYSGEPALHIVTVSNYTLTGRGASAGQEFTLEGTGVRRSQEYLGLGGRYLGAISSDTSSSTAVVTAMGMSIPIKQTQADTLRIVP